MAERIQRRRTKGWRMPEGAVYVGRPSPFGNPFTVRWDKDSWYVDLTALGYFETKPEALHYAVVKYRLWMTRDVLGGAGGRTPPDVTPLAGRDLACWCPREQPCHADVLLELANGGDDRG